MFLDKFIKITEDKLYIFIMVYKLLCQVRQILSPVTFRSPDFLCSAGQLLDFGLTQYFSFKQSQQPKNNVLHGCWLAKSMTKNKPEGRSHMG
jgi:hypothetical protein